MSRFFCRTPFFSRLVLLALIISLVGLESYPQETNPGKSVHAVPATKRIFNDDTTKLQFAIISDLWGGLRPGVFEDAVIKLNLLQPQFVISVGDLIDGKSYDPAGINRQWNEFDRAIQPLTMPFFYVPGNHDISNAVMENEWKKRLGSPYYHFVYKNTLFLGINTEDGGKGGIRDEQVGYIKKAIAENTAVRWTFLFMHRPVWQGKGDKQEGYEKIEASLKGRNYTLFSGHHHTYLSVTKNGNKHYVLGSTGGGSDLRGEKFGEFDHITWVTLTDKVPQVVNLKLDGIIQEDVVNEKAHTITQTLINEDWLLPIPAVSISQKTKSVVAEIVLNNPTDFPLKISGNPNRPGTTVIIHPAVLEMTLPPQTKRKQKIVLTNKNGSAIDLAKLPYVDISLRGEFHYNETTYSLAANKKLLLSWKLIPERLKAPTHSATLYNGQDTSGMIGITNPEQITGPWYWSGPADGLLRFKVARDERYAYLTVLISDDQWVKDPTAPRDTFLLHLEDNAGETMVITLSPGDTKPRFAGNTGIVEKDIVSTVFFEDQLMMVEFKLPLKKIVKSDQSFRINIGYRDQDNLPEKQVSTLFWKPLWNSEGDYSNSGTFILK